MESPDLLHFRHFSGLRRDVELTPVRHPWWRRCRRPTSPLQPTRDLMSEKKKDPGTATEGLVPPLTDYTLADSQRHCSWNPNIRTSGCGSGPLAGSHATTGARGYRQLTENNHEAVVKHYTFLPRSHLSQLVPGVR